MLKIILLAVFCFILIFSSNVKPQVLDTPFGKVEFIGLHNWKAQQLYDSIRSINPTKPIVGCAYEITSKLGFAGASVVIVQWTEKEKYSIVTVVEPQYKSGVKYLDTQKGGMLLNPKWVLLKQIFSKDDGHFQAAVKCYYDIKFRSTDDKTLMTVKAFNKISGDYQTVWDELSSINTFNDFEFALSTIKSDSGYVNRIMAVASLINWADSDSFFISVIDCLRDNDARVSEMAREVLIYCANSVKRHVDWSNGIKSLRYIIDGTNLFAFTSTLELLTATKISPALAPDLLKNGGDLVMGYLKANRPQERKIAYNFLVQISGKDFGYDASKWQEWINSL